MAKMITGAVAALIALCMVLAFTAAAAPAEAKDSKTLKYVGTEDVDVQFQFYLYELADSELIGLIPEDVLYELVEYVEYDDLVTISLDGKFHVNAMLKERNGAWDANVHVMWHGTISLQVGDYPELVFDVKNAQLKVVATVTDSLEGLDLMVNFHINADLNVDVADVSVDLKTHVLLAVEDGQLVKLKIWLPGFVEELLDY